MSAQDLDGNKWPVYEDEMRKQKEQLLDQRINAGADGGSGDNVGGPCQESYRNLMDELHPPK